VTYRTGGFERNDKFRNVVYARLSRYRKLKVYRRVDTGPINVENGFSSFKHLNVP